MRVFSELGAAVEERWRRHNHDERVFPRIAEDALRRFRPVVSPRRITEWMIEAPTTPTQHADASFGQPPIVVYQGSRFFIELLFWLDGSPAIHQHSFSGAFAVLAGSSLHSLYRFALETPVNFTVGLGKLERQSVELLGRGDVRQILAGHRLIHATFHLDRPTVTIVVRTYTEPTPTVQYTYLPPSLAYEPLPERLRAQPRLDRQLKLLDVLWQCGGAGFVGSAERFLQRSDFYAAMALFDRYFRLRLDAPNVFERLVAATERRHGRKLAKALTTAFAEDARREEIVLLRRRVRDPAHRFFLAVVLSLSDRRAILAFVAERFPRRDPKKLILGWLRELTSPNLDDRQRPLPFVLGDASLQVVAWMLDGASWPKISARLGRVCEHRDLAHQTKNVRALVTRLKKSWLRPLFA